jgi:hypothetical protein
MRGTSGDFKRDADGSEKQFGFILPPRNSNSNTVTIFESPTDALSYQTLFPGFDGWFLSLGCTAIAALSNFLERHKYVKNCTVCTDNDDAGNTAAVKIAEIPGITVSRSLSPAGKDWNDFLVQTKLHNNESEVNILDDKRKNIRFINTDYEPLFTVKDGDSIKLTIGYDGEEKILKCRYIDDAHIRLIGKYSNDYHIREFAERMKEAGNKYEVIPNQKGSLNVLAAKYGEALQDVSIPMTEAALRKLVGGKYAVELLYVDGQGINGRYGPQIHGGVLRGKDGLAVCGITDNTPTSLHPYWAQKYKRELSPAERPQKQPSLLGSLEKAKAEANAHNAANIGETASKRTSKAL